jgi:hypothetical protein
MLYVINQICVLNFSGVVGQLWLSAAGKEYLKT